MYQVEFLPIARQDMTEIVRYISHELGNPKAADRLSNEMIEAADRLMEFPYSNAVFLPIRPLKHEYRRRVIQNYNMFYWIDETEKRITIARVIYGRRNYEKLL